MEQLRIKYEERLEPELLERLTRTLEGLIERISRGHRLGVSIRGGDPEADDIASKVDPSEVSEIAALQRSSPL